MVIFTQCTSSPTRALHPLLTATWTFGLEKIPLSHAYRWFFNTIYGYRSSHSVGAHVCGAAFVDCSKAFWVNLQWNKSLKLHSHQLYIQYTTKTGTIKAIVWLLRKCIGDSVQYGEHKSLIIPPFTSLNKQTQDYFVIHFDSFYVLNMSFT